MRQEEIEKMLGRSSAANPVVVVNFKTRKAIKGFFVKAPDYQELSKKNLWRIVYEAKIGQYNQSHDLDLAKIFNGAEFTKLEVSS
jgi:hypothetical protein